MQLLNLKGAIVTLDAMGTQTEIAQQIKSGGGDYVLALKGNQGKLFQQVEGWFDQAIARDWQGIESHIPHPQLSHKLSPSRDLSKNT